jgi:hypothetical protein
MSTNVPDVKVTDAKSDDTVATKSNLKSKIASFIADNKSEFVEPIDDAPPPAPKVDDNLTNPIPVVKVYEDTPPADDTPPPPPQPNTPQDSQNFKTLKSALEQRDAKIAELEAELNKVKPNAEKAERLQAEVEAKTKEITEWQTFKERHNLLSSTEFHSRIVSPRQTIATQIKNELKADGIDETVWEQAQAATSRKDLEDIVDSNIDSQLLKNQFYQLFFQDLELRKAEAAALEAPQKYLETVRNEEAAAKNIQREQAKTGFNQTWSAAQQDAYQMMIALGDNKLPELVHIEGNEEHNTKIVKPIVDAADQAAMSMLQERIEAGLPVDRNIAARAVYLWRQAVAAQAVNQERIRWFRETQRLQQENARLNEKLGRQVARNNPTPSAKAGAVDTKPNGYRRGSDLKQTLANFIQQEISSSGE